MNILKKGISKINIENIADLILVGIILPLSILSILVAHIIGPIIVAYYGFNLIESIYSFNQILGIASAFVIIPSFTIIGTLVFYFVKDRIDFF